MKKHTAGNSRLFFIEFLIVLFFFLIISTVCLKLFAHAHRITEHASDLSHAQTMAASAAELLLAGYEKEEALKYCLDKFADETCTLQISENETTFEPTEQNRYYSISVYTMKNERIYELQLSTHTPLIRKIISDTAESPDQEVPS